MNRHRSRWTHLAIALLAVAVLAGSCGDDDSGGATDDPGDVGGGDTPTTEAGQPVHGGRLTVGLEAESNTFLPGRAQMAYSGHTVINAIFDPLVAMNGDGEFEPLLAERLEPSEDLSAWTLTLRDGVVFHDGTPLDAEILKWNFDELHFHSGSLSWGYLNNAGVVGMEVIDELTVRYDLSGPNAAFPDILTLPVGWPVSRDAYEADPDGFGDKPVGTGPFAVQEWVRDDRMVLTRNPDYWRTAENGDQLPYLDELVFRPIPDEQSRVQSLAAGDVDLIQSLRGSTIQAVIDLADDSAYAADLNTGNFSEVVILNVLEPPLDDLRIRRALALAHDPEQAQVVLGLAGMVDIRPGFFGDDSPWFSEAVVAAHPAHDLEAARELVEEYRNDPGRSDGRAPGDEVVVTFSCQPDPSLVELAQLHQALWQEAGFVVEVEQMEAAANIASVVGGPDTDPAFRGTYSTTCWRAGAGADPLTALATFFGPVETNPANFTNFTHPDIDDQLVILRTSADVDERRAAVEAIGLIAAEHVPVIWSTPSPSVVGFRSALRGVTDWTLPSGSPGTGTQLGIPRFHQVWVTE